MKLCTNSCWIDKDEIAEREELCKKHNVKFEFHDGGDYYSSLTLEGDAEDVDNVFFEIFDMHISDLTVEDRDQFELEIER